MVKLLIDGYNLLHSMQEAQALETQDFEAQREELVKTLHNYQIKKNVDITVIFDGAGVGSPIPQEDRRGKVKIVYTSQDQSADRWIHEACRKKQGNYAVVSNDLEVRASALDFECTPLYCEELIKKLNPILEPPELNPYLEDKDDDGPLYPRVSTKKRGSGRRTSKRDRKKKSILKKI